MRIQHNIPALSAYRNYSHNVSAVNKNLEKLSSGYRINRAGDDAAGLAISEKMRAQISGLEQAQSNAKSGINLVQTAEGAMTEIHDMLNRMYTLAEQSANGTYDDDVDRVQLQKEVESLRTEINRIADSTNYNGIKLLDGSLDGATHTTTTTGTFKVGGTGAGTLPAVNPANINNGGTILHESGAEGSDETSFGVAFHNTQVTGDKGDTFKLTIGDAVLTGTLKVDAGKGAEISAEDIVKALAGTDATKIDFGAAYDPAALSIGGAAYTVAADGKENVKITLNDGEDAPTDVAFDIKIEKGTDATPTGQAPDVTVVNGTDAAADDPTVTGGTIATGNSTDGTAAIKGHFDVDLTGITLDAAASKLTITIGTDTVDSDAVAEGADAEAIAAAFDGKTATVGGIAMTISAANGVLTFTQDTAATATMNGFGNAVVTATKAAATKGTVGVDFGTKTGVEVIGSSITIDGVTYDFIKQGETYTGANTKVEIAENATAAQMATALATAAGTTKGANVGTVAVGSAPDTNKVTFTAGGTAGADSKLAAESSSSTLVNVAVTGQNNWKAINQKVKTEASGDKLAQTSFDLTADMAADGAKIRIGETEYTFTTDAAKKDNEGMVYVGDLSFVVPLPQAPGAGPPAPAILFTNEWRP